MSTSIYQCQNCGRLFDKKITLDNHLKNLTACLRTPQHKKYIISTNPSKNDPPLDMSRHVCIHCGATFSQQSSLARHIKGYCHALKTTELQQLNAKIQKLIENQEKIMEKQEDQIKKLKEDHTEEIRKVIENQEQFFQQISKVNDKPSQIINNNLNVMCVSEKGDYFAILTEKMGADKAIGFIAGCVMDDDSLRGDIKLLNKVYLEGHSPEDCAIQFLDIKRKKIRYRNEQGQFVIDIGGENIFTCLYNCLQNTYLAGVEYLKAQDPNIPLDDPDIQNWTSRIHKRNEKKAKLKKKLINELGNRVASHKQNAKKY